jgi:hypothetical protein
VADLPDEAIGRVIHQTPDERIAELLRAVGGHQRAIDLAVQHERPGVASGQVGNGDVHAIGGAGDELVVGDRIALMHHQWAARRVITQHRVECG